MDGEERTKPEAMGVAHGPVYTLGLFSLHGQNESLYRLRNGTALGMQTTVLKALLHVKRFLKNLE